MFVHKQNKYFETPTINNKQLLTVSSFKQINKYMLLPLVSKQSVLWNINLRCLLVLYAVEYLFFVVSFFLFI